MGDSTDPTFSADHVAALLRANQAASAAAIPGSGGIGLSLPGLQGMTPEALNAILTEIAAQQQRRVPVPLPGKALVSGNLSAPLTGYEPHGVIFPGGLPYRPPYGAQTLAAGGMALANILDQIAKQRGKKGSTQADTTPDVGGNEPADTTDQGTS